MDMEDFELVVEDLDELFGPDMALFSPLSATTETQYSAPMFGVLEGPLPIHLVGVVNDEAPRTEGTVSPSSSSRSIHSSASGTDTFGDNDRAISLFTSQQRSRVTTKERIRLLHTEASQLVIELQATQKRIKALARARKADAVTDSKRSSEPMWESIAARQLKYREESESKNAHLRKLVESQTRYLRSVRRALRRQPNREEVDTAIRSLTPTNCQRIPREVDTASTFGSLLGRLDEQYSRVNQMWATLGFPDLPCPGRQCLTDKPTVRNEARIEFISRSTLPFRIKAVEETVWKYLLDVRLRQSAVKSAKLVDYRDRTIQVSWSMESKYNGFVASNTSSSVSRKFVECDRVVFVTLLVTEPFVKNHVAIDGIKFFTTIVRVLKPGSSMPDGSRATVTESFWSTRGYDVDGVSTCPPWKLEPFHELGIGAMEAAIAGEQGVVEDLLVRSEIRNRPTRL